MKTPHLAMPHHYAGRLSARRQLFNELAPCAVALMIGASAALADTAGPSALAVIVAAAASLSAIAANMAADLGRIVRPFWFASLAVLALCAVVALPGCTTNPADTLAAVDERIAQAAAAEAEARRAGDEAAAAAFAKAGGELRTSRGGLAAAIVAQPSPAENAAAAAGTAAAGALGGPFGQALAVAAGLIVPIVQQIRIRRREAAAASLVRAFDLLRAKAPPVADAMKENRSMLRDAMTPEALRFVDEHRAT